MKSKIMLFFCILLLCSFIISCGEKECSKTEDCTKMDCFDVSCEDHICKKVPLPNCCGNLMCENKGDNSNPKSATKEKTIETVCSCPKDCKKPACEGKAVIKEKGTKKYYGDYLQNMCVEDKCMRTIDTSMVKKIPLLSEKNVENTDIEIGVNFNKPFDISTDKLMVTISLKDYDEAKAKMPFMIKSIKVMKYDILYGQLNVNKQLVQIGSGIKEFIPLTYEPESLESEEKLVLKIDYEVTKISSKGEEQIRSSFTEPISQKMLLVVTGEADLGDE